MKTLRILQSPRAQSIALCLVLKDGVDYGQGEMLIKKAVLDKKIRNLDLVFTRSQVFAKGEEYPCLRIESFCLPTTKDGLDVKRWRTAFLSVMDKVASELSDWGMLKDINDAFNYVVVENGAQSKSP